MAKRKIKDAKDLSTNELIYFKGHAQATFMSDGRTVEEAINDIDLSDKQDKINDLAAIRSGASKGATSAQQEELQTGASAVVVPDGVLVDGGGSTYALPDVDETTKEASDYVLATEDYVDSKAESGGIYLTPFTVEQFCTGDVILTDEQRNDLRNAALQNRIIGMPYSSASYNRVGYIVADYLYEYELDFWKLTLGVIYNESRYSNYIRSNGNTDFRFSNIFVIAFKTIEYFVTMEDGVAEVSGDFDNCIYYVEGECTELHIYFSEARIGKTVRFFTGESCSLFIGDVYWANGEIPTIEPYTHYELSLVANMEGVLNAVLTPFKAAE